MTRAVTLVCGPPCAGKTTYVRGRARPGEVVLDADTLGEAEMRRGIDRVAAMADGVAWVIRCAPGPDERARLAVQLGATDVIVLRPDNDTLFARARRRPSPGQAVRAVRRWLAIEAGREPEPARSRLDPAPRRGTRW